MGFVKTRFGKLSDELIINVWFISFFVFWSKWQRNEKNQLSFSGKMRIFYTENKQTGQPIFFVFGHFDRKTKTGMNRTKINWLISKWMMYRNSVPVVKYVHLSIHVCCCSYHHFLSWGLFRHFLDFWVFRWGNDFQ